MGDISVLVGGKAGDGINRAGMIIARILAICGYQLYMYYDYPSLIRGGHNFAIVRASEDKVGTHHETVDFLLALDKNTLDIHATRITDRTEVIYNSDLMNSGGFGIPMDSITKEEGGIPIMANSCIIGAFSRVCGIDWDTVQAVLIKEIPRETDLNLRIARRGFDAVPDRSKTLKKIKREHLPLFSGNEAIGLGLLHGGLDAYISYPMTPSSSLLHFLASVAADFSVRVVHPESEISVMLIAQGCSYAGMRTAVGTSGGGFCLMTEGLSMAGMTEIPTTIVVSQRGGPSTGTPTYTAQGDLHFILNAGQGEFPRFIVAPGDAEQAFTWSARALNLSWKYQVPSFILVDKSLSEGIYSFSRTEDMRVPCETPPSWDGSLPYRRYADSRTGISPLAHVPVKGAAIKVNSYAHDEYGYSTEEPGTVSSQYEKRMRKLPMMQEEIEIIESVLKTGPERADVALVSWGSNAWVCREVAANLGIGAIQPIVLDPFPQKQFSRVTEAIGSLISVEDNFTGQLARHLKYHGFGVANSILRYDGRPFSLEELTSRVQEMIS